MSDAQVRYDSVFAQASFQFCGHLDEYLIRHARHLGLLYFQTRFGKGRHLLRIYENGKLVEERKLSFSGSVASYYLGMWRHWNRELRRFCRDKDGVTAIYTHPLLAVGRSFRRKVRDIFWQWDYFPDGSFVSRLFNAVARRYAPRCDDYRPLTRKIAQAMGRPNAQVMMLGMIPPARFGDPKSSRILMVGQLRGGQGIENVLDFVAANRDYSLSLIGAAAHGFEKVIASRIAAAKMADRVFFPNKFVSDAELREEAVKCFVSLALYDTAPNNLTHYADPGKVKSCIEMGLPVAMTRISEIVPCVEKFKAGEVIDSIADLPVALAKIRRNPESYFAGCKAFSEYFDFERYYFNVFAKEAE